jgi:hypothetical protein
MNAFFQRSFKYLTVLLSLVVLIMSQAALAQGNSSGKGNGKNKNVGVGNASDGISASIVTDKDIFYTGDPLSISIRFNRGAELVSGGEVDAYLIVFAPSVDDSTAEDSEDIDTETDDSTAVDTEASLDALSDAIILPVSDQASSDEQKLFELEAVDVSTLPAGTYQLGLILTNPGGDPLVINDWFKGLLGLIDIVGLTVSDEALSFDEDGDGQVDDDDDGFSDDDTSDSSDDEEVAS